MSNVSEGGICFPPPFMSVTFTSAKEDMFLPGFVCGFVSLCPSKHFKVLKTFDMKCLAKVKK